MSRYLALLLLLSSPALYAQPLQPIAFDLALGAGGVQDDLGANIAVDGSGAVLLTFTAGGTGSLFVGKLSAAGDTLWYRRVAATASPTMAGGLTHDGDDNVYVAGSFSGTATWEGGGSPAVSLTSRGGADAFLASYDPDGRLRWVVQAGGSGRDDGRGVAVAQSGEVYFAGGFEGTATFGAGTSLTSAGGEDAFLTRFDSDGGLVWAQPGGGSGTDGAWGVAVDEEAKAYVVGTFEDTALFGASSLTSAGLTDLFVARYDRDGAVEWTRQIGGTEQDAGRGIGVYGCCVNSVVAVYVTGAFEGTLTLGSDGLTSAGLTDVLIASLDGDGVVRWGVRGGGPGDDTGTAVAIAPWFSDIPEAGVYVAGVVDGDGDFSVRADAFGYASHGGRDGFLLGLFDYPAGGAGGPSGSPELVLLGGPGEDEASGLSVGGQRIGTPPSYPLAVTGSFSGQASIGDLTLTSTGGHDVFVGYAARTLVGTEPQPPAPFQLGPAAPNPFSDATVLPLTLAAPQPVRAEVVDLLGRRVALLHDGPLAAGLHALRWAPDDAPAGLYLVRVTTEEETLLRKVSRLR